MQAKENAIEEKLDEVVKETILLGMPDFDAGIQFPHDTQIIDELREMSDSDSKL
jgi:hypothetical protein